MKNSLATYNDRVQTLTASLAYPNGMVQTVNERQNILDWCELKGFQMHSLRKENVDFVLKNSTMPDPVRELLSLRQAAGKTSLGKLIKMLNLADTDSRLRDSLAWHGAATGRWAGRAWQPHNLPRECMSDEEAKAFHEALKSDEIYTYLWNRKGRDGMSTPDVVSSALRSFLVAEPGKRLLVSDFSSIEARVLAWFAGCNTMLDAFVAKKCVYTQFAARATGKAEADIPKKSRDRQLGKAAVLGLGYGMGGGKFRDTAEDQYSVVLTLEEADIIKALYRKTYPEVPKFWSALESAFSQAILNKTTVTCGKLLVGCNGEWGFIVLPSKRAIWYREPMVKKVPNPWRDGATMNEISSMGQSMTKQWVRQSTWGGTLVENCLSGGTAVVTDRGCIPLRSVSSSDRVWDGENWVEHCGLILKGIRPTIDVGGVFMTEDHLIWDSGWKEARYVDPTSASLEFSRHYRAPFWGFSSHQISRVQRQARSVGSTMRLRGRKADDRERVPSRENLLLRVSDCSAYLGKSDHSRGILDSSLRSVPINAGPLSKKESSRFPQLRRSWDNGVPPMESSVREFQRRHAPDVRRRVGSGEEEQHGGLQQRELPVGDENDKLQEQTEQYCNRVRSRENDRRRSVGHIRGESYDYLQPGTGWLARRQAPPSSGFSEQVFDLMNCGPNHRFTVVRPNGEFLLVHNCVQAAAADLLTESIRRTENAGYACVLSVHDEVIAESDKDEAEFHRLMKMTPAWGMDLPLDCETHSCERYGK